jgi:hypothetical protein
MKSDEVCSLAVVGRQREPILRTAANEHSGCSEVSEAATPVRVRAQLDH